MSVYADTSQVNPRIFGTKLLDCIFLILKTIVAEVAITVIMIPFRPVRMTAPVAHGYDNESELGQPVGPGKSSTPLDVVGFHLRARINVIAYRIDLCGVEIEWLVDGAIQIGDAVGSLDGETLREFVSGSEKE